LQLNQPVNILGAQIARIRAMGVTIKLNTKMGDLPTVRTPGRFEGVTPMLARSVLIYGRGKSSSRGGASPVTTASNATIAIGSVPAMRC
jgi:hypothetical protein